MEITTSAGINGRVARQIRLELGLSQREFWGAVDVKQSVSSKYESGMRRIPDPIKTLLFIRYVAGLRHDLNTEQGAAEFMELTGKRA